MNAKASDRSNDASIVFHHYTLKELKSKFLLRLLF